LTFKGITKKYDQPRTPYQRLKACPDISEKIKKQLTIEFVSLNPVKLREAVAQKIKQILKVALP